MNEKLQKLAKLKEEAKEIVEEPFSLLQFYYQEAAARARM
jgi:hypothetical protein